MGAKNLVTQAKIYTKIEDELDIDANLDIPSSAATLTNFKALANMSDAGSVLVEIRGVEYAIPTLLNA